MGDVCRDDRLSDVAFWPGAATVLEKEAYLKESDGSESARDS